MNRCRPHCPPCPPWSEVSHPSLENSHVLHYTTVVLIKEVSYERLSCYLNRTTFSYRLILLEIIIKMSEGLLIINPYLHLTTQGSFLWNQCSPLWPLCWTCPAERVSRGPETPPDSHQAAPLYWPTQRTGRRSTDVIFMFLFLSFYLFIFLFIYLFD